MTNNENKLWRMMNMTRDDGDGEDDYSSYNGGKYNDFDDHHKSFDNVDFSGWGIGHFQGWTLYDWGSRCDSDDDDDDDDESDEDDDDDDDDNGDDYDYDDGYEEEEEDGDEKV